MSRAYKCNVCGKLTEDIIKKETFEIAIDPEGNVSTVYDEGNGGCGQGECGTSCVIAVISLPHNDEDYCEECALSVIDAAVIRLHKLRGMPVKIIGKYKDNQTIGDPFKD